MPNVERAEKLLKLAQPLLEALTDYIRQLEILAIVTTGKVRPMTGETPAFIDEAYQRGRMLSVTPAVLLRNEPPIYSLTINGVVYVIIRCLDIETGLFAYDVYHSTWVYHSSVYQATIDELARHLISFLAAVPELCDAVP